MSRIVSMALPASSLSPRNSKFHIKPIKDPPGNIHRYLPVHASPNFSPACTMKISMAQFGEPSKIKLQMNVAKERLWEAIPGSVKDFPWKKAEDLLLKRLVFAGQKAFKWSFITLFIFNSVSDVIFAIARNHELLIPFGLLLGCLATDLLKEIWDVMLHTSKEKGLNLPLLAISCFFVLVKVVSTYFSVRTQVFLLHVANGGLMQVLWLWRGLSKDTANGDEENVAAVQDTQIAINMQE
uniref:Uncharacterized protein MANES_18G051200 n=1 Tax=Rhizophora mucronata TaxID=61149 RepID=A0A2P2JL66_RHIMU